MEYEVFNVERRINNVFLAANYAMQCAAICDTEEEKAQALNAAKNARSEASNLEVSITQLDKANCGKAKIKDLCRRATGAINMARKMADEAEAAATRQL